jgi:hypothetical protein
LLVYAKCTSANLQATATDFGSIDCINAVHGPSSCSMSDSAIKLIISTHGIWGEGIGDESQASSLMGPKGGPWHESER